MRLFRRGEQASTLDLLVVGLGNPGREYATTRHNVGFMVADELARRHGGSWRSKFSGEVADLRVDGARLALLKPQTYMNESGRSVAAAAKASALKTPEFLRLRIGVGRPERGDPRPVSDWVLSPFEPEADVGGLVGRAADAVETLVRDGLEEAQQRFNER